MSDLLIILLLTLEPDEEPRQDRRSDFEEWWNYMLTLPRVSQETTDLEDFGHPAGLPGGFFD